MQSLNYIQSLGMTHGIDKSVYIGDQIIKGQDLDFRILYRLSELVDLDSGEIPDLIWSRDPSFALKANILIGWTPKRIFQCESCIMTQCVFIDDVKTMVIVDTILKCMTTNGDVNFNFNNNTTCQYFYDYWKSHYKSTISPPTEPPSSPSEIFPISPSIPIPIPPSTRSSSQVSSPIQFRAHPLNEYPSPIYGLSHSPVVVLK